jgi:hypothetical protein
MADRLAAIRPLSHVEMKMVAVEGVGIGAEHDPGDGPAGKRAPLSPHRG